MHIIYSSDQYSVTEFGVDEASDALRFGGYEIIDKLFCMEIFIAGELAKVFRQGVEELIATEPTTEDIDSFLGNYEALMHQPLVLH